MSSTDKSLLADMDKSGYAPHQIPQEPPPAYALNDASASSNSNQTTPMSHSVPRSVMINELSREIFTGLVSVVPVGAPNGSMPLYTVKVDSNSKPNITFYSGEPTADNVVGEASFTYKSNTMMIYIRGKQTKATINGLTGSFKIESELLPGECKWSCSKISAFPNKFTDATGALLATTTSESWRKGVRRLDMQVPANKDLLELLAFTMTACYAYSYMIIFVQRGLVGSAS